MQKLDSHSATPLYQQLYLELKNAVETGVYKSGEQIPSEDHLRERYGISRITVRKALEKLTEEEILVKRHGKGTFVAQADYVETFGAEDSFTTSCQLMNAVPSTKILVQETAKAEKQVAEILKVPKGDPVIWLRRLRSIDGLPVIVESDYFTEEFKFLLTLDLEDQSLLQVLREQGKREIRDFRDVFDIQMANREEANLLNCDLKEPLLRVRQRVYGSEGRILYYNEQKILSEHYKYAVHIALSKRIG